MLLKPFLFTILSSRLWLKSVFVPQKQLLLAFSNFVQLVNLAFFVNFWCKSTFCRRNLTSLIHSLLSSDCPPSARGGVKSKQTNFKLNFIKFLEYFFSPFELIELYIFESNKFQTNPVSENLTPAYSWSRIKFKLIFIKFFKVSLPFQINRIANFQIKSNEFRTNSNLTPPLPSVSTSY